MVLSHKRKNIFVFGIMLLISSLVRPSTVNAFDTSAFTVPLGDFDERVYSENKTGYRIESSSEKFGIPDTPFQRIFLKKKPANKTVLHLITGNLEQDIKLSMEERTRYLRKTRFLDFDDPALARISNKIKSDKDILSAAEYLVYRHISSKDIGIPILRASQVYKTRSGDCSEHTVLVVSILRGAGIPSRAVAGMLLTRNFRGRKNCFVYHMWAEAYYKKRWHLVDPSFPGRKHYNRYIAFTHHSLQTEMPLSYLRSINAIKNFSVYYVSNSSR